MILGRVRGEVVATIKHKAYENRRMLLLDRVDPQNQGTGRYIVAIDAVNATVGQTVLVLDEGNGARQVVNDPTAPIRSVIVGIVDDVQIEG